VATEEKWAASTYNHYRSLLMLIYPEARRFGKVSPNPARDIGTGRRTIAECAFLLVVTMASMHGL